MRKLIQSTLFLVAVLASTPAFAATATDFYLSLLRRGAAEVEAGRHADAVTPLRLAAFGLVDSIPEYETALAYLAVAYDRLKQQDRVRDSALRILAAERVERRFAALALPSTIRSAFEAAARKVLTGSEVASLSAPVPAPVPVTPPRTESTSRPVVESPSQPATTMPAPSTSSSTTRRPETSTTPAQVKPEPPKPAPAKPQPQATQPAPQPVRPLVDVPSRLAAAERALLAANLVDARRIYRELLEQTNLDHGTWIRIAEGLYRSRDFANTLTAFQRAGALRPGEEAYRYYIAVAAFETRQFERAKRELAAALPHIELTTDVQRYRAKIEGAR